MKNNDEYVTKEFDFSKAVRNPYAKLLKPQSPITPGENAAGDCKQQIDTGDIPAKHAK